MPTDPTGASDADTRLTRASSAVGAGILLSRLAGLLREKLLAYFLGTGLAAEAFRAALRIPNLLQNLLGDGVLTGAFVPTYARMVRDGREEDAGRLAGAVASLLVLVTAVLVLIGVAFAEPITRLLTPGFPPGSPKAELTVTLVRVLTPSLGFLVLSAWCLGVLNAHRHFFRAYVAPVLWNASIIIALSVAAGLGLSDADLAGAVALGALVGAALQFLSQLPAVLRSARGIRLGLAGDVPGLREVLGASVGVIVGRGIVQLSAYLDLVIASLLAAGAVAALGYAQVLYLLPVSLFGMSVAAASLPDLATTPTDDRGRLLAGVERGMSRIATFVVPTSIAYVTLGGAIVTVLFGGGAFGRAETRQVSVVLAAYAVGLVATTQSRLLQSALHALDDTRTPARTAGLRVLVGTVVGVSLMLVLDGFRWDASGPVRVAGPGLADLAARGSSDSLHRLGAAGLALGASVGAWVEWLVLRRSVARRTGSRSARTGVGRPLIAATSIVAGAPVGRWFADRADPFLAGAPVALEGLVLLLPPLLLFLAAAAALDLGDIPGVQRLRRVTRSRGPDRISRRPRTR